MFDRIFDNWKSQFEDWVKSGVEQLGEQLQEKFGIPEPDGEFELFRSFTISEPLITQGCISVEKDSWCIEAYETQPSDFLSTSSDNPIRKVKLFEVDEPNNIQECIVACRAFIKTSNSTEKVNLCLGFDRPVNFCGVEGSNISRYYHIGASGKDWQEYEVRYFWQKDKYPGKLWINLDFLTAGTVWIKDVRLLQAAAKIKP